MITRICSDGANDPPTVQTERGGRRASPGHRDQDRQPQGARNSRWPTAGLDKTVYRDRNVAERSFARLKQFRAIATRFDELGVRYRAGLVLASLILWLREPTR